MRLNKGIIGLLVVVTVLMMACSKTGTSADPVVGPKGTAVDKLAKGINLSNWFNDYSDAVEVANYLVKKGMNFKDAHTATGKLVLYSEQKNKDFCDLSLSEFKIFSKLFGKDIYEALKVK